MKRTVTVVAAASGATADVRLDPTATVADALPELMQLTGATNPSIAVTRGGVPLALHLPLAHLNDGDVLVLGDGTCCPAKPAARVVVTAGPDAGRLLDLPPGRHVLGRAGGPFASSDLGVSRRHVEIAVAADGALAVTDLDSRNGSEVDGTPLHPGRSTPWSAGAELRIGATRLVHGRAFAPAATAAGPSSTTTVNRPPRLLPGGAPRTITFPMPPPETTAGRLPLLASIAPLLAGVLLALVMHRWEFLAFAVMSPLVVLGQTVAERWSARRHNHAAERAHAAAVALAEQALQQAVAEEAARRHRDAPDLAALVAAAVDRNTLLWHRGLGDDDALTARLGIGTAPATVCIDGDRRVPDIDDVPITLDLRRAGVTGVCGEAAAALVRSLLVQTTTLLGPTDLRVTVFAPGRAARWAWTRWLPHATLAVTAAQLNAALDEVRTTTHTRRHLVVVDGIADAHLAGALAADPAHVSMVWLADDERQLPAACCAVVTVTRVGAPRLRVRFGELDHDAVAADLLPIDVAEQVSRALCPLRQGSTDGGPTPTSVAWSQLYDIPLGRDDATSALLRRWRDGPSTTFCLGMTTAGPLVLDLKADGPHALVAGTTGAGKSELLQSLVASLVAGNSPVDLNLLLVDFKGGAAFGPCAALPHTVGVLTDLDPAATERAIESLTAELRRRERVLAAAGAVDLDSWRASAVAEPTVAGTLPRLVIVVDEFATLAEELPDFIGGLVGIAQRGRSLGIHLVLATQRPEGAVSADIRANTRLRICLAVARDAESRDVIDSPRAVGISRSTPGRALVRVGAEELVEVQAARVAGPLRSSAGGHRRGCVRLVPVTAWHDEPEPAVDAAASGTELEALVNAAVEAARLTGATVAAPSWLPPLPPLIPLSALSGADAEVPIGLADLPQQQAQLAHTLPLASAEPLLLVGGARSGRTSGAIAITTALAGAASPDRLHVWAIDTGRSLHELADLPHVGAIVDARDADRVDRLLTFLVGEVERRRATGHEGEPQLLLTVDGWDGLGSAAADIDPGRNQDLLLHLLADGPAAGLRVVVTSDRTGLSGRLSAAVRQRLCLRLPDPADYALLGLPLRRVPAQLPPGRAIRAEDLTVVQLAVADDVTGAAARAWPAAAKPPRRFDPLPARVPLHTLGPAGTGVIVGLRGDDLAPVVVEPDEAGGAFLVAGPPRSGRSTALVSIAAQLRGRPVVALCPRRGPLRQRRDLALIADPADPDAARTALAAVADGASLLVDDIDLVDDATVLDGIEAAVRAARDGGGFVVLAGTTDAMAASFRGPVAQARRGRAGLLLRPEGPHDGELLGVRLRRRPGGDPPGRGVLALHGRVVPVQVPDPG